MPSFFPEAITKNKQRFTAGVQIKDLRKVNTKRKNKGVTTPQRPPLAVRVTVVLRVNSTKGSLYHSEV
jgi:hypothetical protein